jgi:hypothetical protein
MFRCRLVAAAAGLGFATEPVRAQELSLATKPLAEVFSDRAKVTGGVIVGLSTAATRVTFDPGALFIASGIEAGDQVCIRVTTRDGRYWSLNAYGPAKSSAVLPRFEYPTGFARDLASYRAEDIAIRAVRTTDCHEDAEGALLPVAFDRAGAATELVVLVNAGRSHARAKLGEDGTWTECETPEGQRVAYTARCRLALGGRFHATSLHIALRGLTGGVRQLDPYPVALGPR